MQRRSKWGWVGLVLLLGCSPLGCSPRIVSAPPPPPVIDTEHRDVIVDSLPVTTPEVKEAPAPTSAPPAPHAEEPPSPPKPGGSDPFRSDTVDDNKTGHEITNKILTLPVADPAPPPAPPTAP